MPSHLANWMKEEKKKIKAYHKWLDDLVKNGTLSGLVNYTFHKENDMPLKKGKSTLKNK